MLGHYYLFVVPFILLLQEGLLFIGVESSPVDEVDMFIELHSDYSLLLEKTKVRHRRDRKY